MQERLEKEAKDEERDIFRVCNELLLQIHEVSIEPAPDIAMLSHVLPRQILMATAFFPLSPTNSLFWVYFLLPKLPIRQSGE